MSVLLGRMKLLKTPLLSQCGNSATINIRKQVYGNTNQITYNNRQQKTNDGTDKASLIQTIKLLVYTFQKLSRHYSAQSVYISKIDGFKILSKQINNQDSIFYVRSPCNNYSLQKLVAKTVTETTIPSMRQKTILNDLFSKSILEATSPQPSPTSKPLQQLTTKTPRSSLLSKQMATPSEVFDLLKKKPKEKPREVKPEIRYPPIDDSTDGRIAITAKIAEFVINCNRNGERPVPYSLNNFIRQQLYKVQYVNNCWQPKWLWPSFPLLEPKLTQN